MLLPILTYHRLLRGPATRDADPHRISVSVAQFRSHLSWLRRLGYQTVRLDDYAKALQGKMRLDAVYEKEGKLAVRSKYIGLTFDDGYEEVLTLGLPLLQEFGFTATVFAVSAELGGHNRWDNGDARLLTGEQYKTLLKAGISVGSHTRTHAHLPRLFDPQARQEIIRSKRDLESALGVEIGTLAYPYGETNERVESLVREAGYLAAFATDQAPVDHLANVFRLRRTTVFPSNNTFQVFLKTQAWYPALQDWKRNQLR